MDTDATKKKIGLRPIYARRKRRVPALRAGMWGGFAPHHGAKIAQDFLAFAGAPRRHRHFYCNI